MGQEPLPHGRPTITACLAIQQEAQGGKSQAVDYTQ